MHKIFKIQILIKTESFRYYSDCCKNRTFQALERKRDAGWRMDFKIELVKMATLIALIRDNRLDSFIINWKPFVDFLRIKYNNIWLSEGFKD